MCPKLYILRKKDIRYKNVWKVEGFFDSYKEAQINFIYRDGAFSIEEVELNKRCKLPDSY